VIRFTGRGASLVSYTILLSTGEFLATTVIQGYHLLLAFITSRQRLRFTSFTFAHRRRALPLFIFVRNDMRFLALVVASAVAGATRAMHIFADIRSCTAYVCVFAVAHRKHDWRHEFQTRFASATILLYDIVAAIRERSCQIHRRALDALAARLPLVANVLNPVALMTCFTFLLALRWLCWLWL